MERGLEDMSSILKVEDLVKYYGEGENQVCLLYTSPSPRDCS